MSLKRLEVKYIRDKAKAAYKKDKECYICGTSEDLQFHHFYSITQLWELWKKKNNITIETVEDIEKYRDIFIQEHHREFYEEAVTLCKFHHMERLHKIYGQSPDIYTAEKQKKWCESRRAKEYKK